MRMVVVLSVVQSACQGLAASMATVTVGVLRSVTLLSFASRSFASVFLRFVCWVAKAFAAGCLSVVAVVGSARDLAAPMMVAVPVVSRAVVVLVLALRGSVAISACFACSCAAGLAAADFLAAVDEHVEGARGLVVSMTVLGEVTLRVVRVRVRSPCGRAAMLAGFAACGVAAAAACVVGIVVDDEFFVARGGEGGVGKLSLVSFFWCPGWL
jgi:hypothetical protein